MTDEVWRDIPGYEGLYAVSTLGRVRSYDRVQSIPPNNKQKVRHDRFLPGRILAPAGSGLQKRPMVGLYKDGANRLAKVYHLVLEAFVGPKPDRLVACHNDGDVQNSRLENLRWDTQAGNLSDKILHGTHIRGSLSKRAKHDEADIIEMRLRYAAGGISQRELGEEYGMSQGDVSCVILRKKWAYAEADIEGRS